MDGKYTLKKHYHPKYQNQHYKKLIPNAKNHNILLLLYYNPDKKLIFTSTDSLDKLFKQDIQKPSQIIFDDTGVISYE